jgi:hypothetical protein
LPSATGKFEHSKPLANGTQTEIHVTNEKTAEATTKSTPGVFKGTVLATALEIECTKVETDTSNISYIENSGTELKHKVNGTSAVIFNGCTVKKPTNCVVKPITVSSKFKGVDGLANPKGGMGLEFEADTNGIFSEFTIEDNGTGKCALKGQKIQVVGTAIATGAPKNEATVKHSGATVKFSPLEEMQKLEIKGSGKPAEFTATFTTNMVTNGVTENPIALTTTT